MGELLHNVVVCMAWNGGHGVIHKLTSLKKVVGVSHGFPIS